MTKTLTKALIAGLALIMALGLAACGSTNAPAASATTAATSAAAQETSSQATATPDLPAQTEKITLKFVCYNWGDAVYGNDMAVFAELEKRTNVHLDWQLLPAEDNLTKLNLIMASGDLPDIISYSDGTNPKGIFDKYGSQGALVALNDLINQYAPNVKSLLANPPYKVPNLQAEITGAGGKIYGLPALTEVHTGEIFGIRQDWLDKVGLKVPETTDDLYTVLKAFREKDPNGNGKADEIPYAPDDGIKDVRILMNAFGAHEGFYADAADKTIKFGPIEDNFKKGLEFAKKLYDEGLLDPTYITIGSDNFRAKVAKDQVGMFYAWPQSGLGFCNTAVKKLDAKNQYVPMLPVKGPNGDRYKERPQAMVAPRTCITSANKHPEETIKYLDYLYSKEGETLMNYGIEGTDYTLDSNGTPVFMDNITKNANGMDPATARISEGMQVGLPYVATYQCESQAVTDENVKAAWKLYTDNDVLFPNFPSLSLDEAQIGEISGKLTDIQTMVDETCDKFIMGKESLDKFNDFVNTIKSAGCDDVLKIYNDAYAKYLANNTLVK